MAETLLRCEHLSVQYGRFVAVDDLSFELRGGDLLGMIGPNGAGKTTTLRALSGLQPASAGRIEIMGFDITRHPVEVGYHLGFTPDTPAVYERLSVTEFLDFIGRSYRLPPQLRGDRIDMWLEKLWLTEKRGEKVESLSRGMRQRLAVARTLVPDPHVVLLDEPAAGLDPAGRLYFRRLLAELRDQGKAIIVSSHILSDLADYCTHAMIMERGRIRSLGTIAQIGGQDETRCYYEIELVHTIGDVEARLARIEGLTKINIGGDKLRVEYDVGKEHAAALLTQLLEEGLPIASFTPAEPDLEEAYIRSGIGQVD
jgi:ABC-2 type transport system ATP-binding protein